MYDGYGIIPNGRPTWAPLLAASGQPRHRRCRCRGRPDKASRCGNPAKCCSEKTPFAGRSSTNHASWTCYVYRHLFAAGRPSRVGPYAQGRWPFFLRIAELWQPTFISSPVCDIVGDAQRAYRYGDSAKCCAEKTLFAGPGRGVFYELRVTRSDVVSLSLLPRSGIRRGRPVKASRYTLRVSRSVVVSLSLSRRNAASESEKKAVVRGS